MAKLVITYEDEQQEFDIEEGSDIIAPCEAAGIPFACTEGVCGTCVVEILEGDKNLSEFTEAEKDFLGDAEISKERLACQCCIQGGCVKLTF
ncbi:2Fe-2S iron-sulfur cluster-binding protein [Candidatus Chlamydia sanziniae]|uniref:Ferredoxin n=1 Tax=Candidatus Chlamydia sanziniae TaxID=1806891 RepID=A0A1A9HYI4_9CHLA|nr:2Fe-2S iron-sulfur cluster-binding protein [Candidatus Chlamydia sanziniae]ANH79104.1 Ferredoxin [Candidatus Chlamydia sanziniae]